ncbi:MAG: hypothetical protein Q8R24_04930 [Legionellaceae bacterium]|nr:hypothetical protein [Legionellaceae bacterium]
MMLINLLTAFNTNLSSKSTTEDVQTSFNFEHPPTVVFVRDLESLEKINHYDQLNEHTFSEKDKKKIHNTIGAIEKSGGYDGNQLLIENLSYDSESNKLYVVAKRAKYSFIRTLQKSPQDGGFDPDSVFYKKMFCTAGVRAPFITEDDYTIFMMRTRPPKVYSVAAGLLEPPKGKLHPEDGGGDLVTYVAYHEALEEFLGDPKHDEDPLYDQLLHARVKIEQPGLSAIAMRRAENSVRIEIEFICPVKVNCNKARMELIIANNKAKDAYEHVSTQSISVPLNSSKRNQATDILGQIPEVGKFVRDPIVAVTSMLANPASRFFPRVLPGKLTTEFVPVSTLRPTVQRTLRTAAEATLLRFFKLEAGIQDFKTELGVIKSAEDAVSKQESLDDVDNSSSLVTGQKK